jgi:hypothetical protein
MPKHQYSTLEAVAVGDANTLVLQGPADPAALVNLRLLHNMGLLENDVVWRLVASATIDPFFVVRTIRSVKERLGLNQEEQFLESSVVFTAGDKNKLGYKVTYHVDLFDNNIQVLERRDDQNAYVMRSTYDAEKLFNELATEPIGDKRLDRFCEVLAKL